METILISMVNRQNSQMVGDLLGSDYHIIYDKSELNENSNLNLSLIIMDLPSWSPHREELKSKKRKRKTIILTLPFGCIC